MTTMLFCQDDITRLQTTLETIWNDLPQKPVASWLSRTFVSDCKHAWTRLVDSLNI